MTLKHRVIGIGFVGATLWSLAVWPSVYRYENAAIGTSPALLRIHRFTGEKWAKRNDTWQPLSDAQAEQPHPTPSPDAGRGSQDPRDVTSAQQKAGDERPDVGPAANRPKRVVEAPPPKPSMPVQVRPSVSAEIARPGAITTNLQRPEAVEKAANDNREARPGPEARTGEVRSRPADGPQNHATPTSTAQTDAAALAQSNVLTLESITAPERASIESACSQAKYVQGPVQYRRCLDVQLDQLSKGPRRPDLSRVTATERTSIESACSQAKYLQGAAAYNRCVAGQMQQRARGPAHPDLSSLSEAELTSIESACSQAKFLQGAAAYNQCLTTQLQQLAVGASHPDLSHLSSSERTSIESACSQAKYLQGPSKYNECLSTQLRMLSDAPRAPDLSGLSPAARRSVEAACSQAKYLQGPASYNQCLVSHLRLGR